jgi:hypothetical protein
MDNTIFIERNSILEITRKVLTAELTPTQIVSFAANLTQICEYDISAEGFYMGFNVALMVTFYTDQQTINLVNEHLADFLTELNVPDEFKSEVLEKEKAFSNSENHS